MQSDPKHSKIRTPQGLHCWLETKWERWCGFLCRIPKQLCKTKIFHLEIHSTAFLAEFLAISEVVMYLILEKNAQLKHCCAGRLSGSYQSTQKMHCNIKTVLSCIRNLYQLCKQNHVSFAWFPGNAGYMVRKWQTLLPNQDLNQKFIALNPLLQSCIPVVFGR